MSRSAPEIRLFIGNPTRHGVEDGVLDENSLISELIAALPPRIRLLIEQRPAPDAEGLWPHGCVGVPQVHVIASASEDGFDTRAAPGMNSVWMLHAWAVSHGVFVEMRSVLGPDSVYPEAYIAAEVAAERHSHASENVAMVTKEDLDKIASTSRRIVAPAGAPFVPELLTAD